MTRIVDVFTLHKKKSQRFILLNSQIPNSCKIRSIFTVKKGITGIAKQLKMLKTIVLVEGFKKSHTKNTLHASMLANDSIKEFYPSFMIVP